MCRLGADSGGVGKVGGAETQELNVDLFQYSPW